MKRLFSAATILLLAVLAGCSSVQQPDIAKAPIKMSGDIPQLWTLVGKAGIRHDGKADSASIYWHQAQEQYEISLTGPFGQGANIKGMPGSAQMSVSGEDEIYQARSPEALMQQLLGWQMPISLARYWVLGRPAPDYDATPLNDLDTNATGFEQLGWQIKVLNAREVASGLVLPTRLQISREQTRFTLVAKEWSLK